MAQGRQGPQNLARDPPSVDSETRKGTGAEELSAEAWEAQRALLLAVEAPATAREVLERVDRHDEEVEEESDGEDGHQRGRRDGEEQKAHGGPRPLFPRAPIEQTGAAEARHQLPVRVVFLRFL